VTRAPAGQVHDGPPAASSAPAAGDPSICPLEDLLAAAARGDRAAFGVLYDRIAPAIYGIARRVARDASLAEEITHDALLDAWLDCPRFDRGKGSARSWLLTIAHRRAVDVVRREQASRNRLARVGGRSWERPYDMVAEQAVQQADAARVGRALDLLTPLQRRAVTLAYYDGFTNREVAEILQVPVPTAKSRIRDGLIRLRDAMPDPDRTAC
jgi:RNA polymerase sigma-70 factor, ECF subfamily